MEFISHPYSFFIRSKLTRLILISNLYKTFIAQLSSTSTVLDFYNLLILLCPDFPKSLMKKTYAFYKIFHFDKVLDINEREFIKKEVDTFTFYLVFSVFYFYEDFFEKSSHVFNLKEEISLPTLLNELQDCTVPKENLYEILISTNTDLMNEYNLNTVNILQDVYELISKNKVLIDEKILISSFMRNYTLIFDLFMMIDNRLQSMENKLFRLLMDK